MVERRGDGNGKFRMGTKYTVEESKGPISKMDFEQIWSSETLTRNVFVHGLKNCYHKQNSMF